MSGKRAELLGYSNVGDHRKGTNQIWLSKIRTQSSWQSGCKKGSPPVGFLPGEAHGSHKLLRSAEILLAETLPQPVVFVDIPGQQLPRCEDGLCSHACP